MKQIKQRKNRKPELRTLVLVETSDFVLISLCVGGEQVISSPFTSTPRSFRRQVISSPKFRRRRFFWRHFFWRHFFGVILLTFLVNFIYIYFTNFAKVWVRASVVEGSVIIAKV